MLSHLLLSSSVCLLLQTAFGLTRISIAQMHSLCILSTFPPRSSYTNKLPTAAASTITPVHCDSSFQLPEVPDPELPMVGNADAVPDAVRVSTTTTSEVPSPGTEVTVTASAVEVTISSGMVEVVEGAAVVVAAWVLEEEMEVEEEVREEGEEEEEDEEEEEAAGEETTDPSDLDLVATGVVPKEEMANGPTWV